MPTSPVPLVWTDEVIRKNDDVMPAPFQIIPATPAETGEILGLEQLCYPDPWNKRIVSTFVIAANLPKKGYVARIIMKGQVVLISRHADCF
jgi:hypothetical protein